MDTFTGHLTFTEPPNHNPFAAQRQVQRVPLDHADLATLLDTIHRHVSEGYQLTGMGGTLEEKIEA